MSEHLNMSKLVELEERRRHLEQIAALEAELTEFQKGAEQNLKTVIADRDRLTRERDGLQTALEKIAKCRTWESRSETWEAKIARETLTALATPEPAKAMNINPEWLHKMAEKEAGKIISVGGLVAEVAKAEPCAECARKDEATAEAIDDLFNARRICTDPDVMDYINAAYNALSGGKGEG